MIRKAKEADIGGILDVLSYYNFKVVEPEDGYIIVDSKILAIPPFFTHKFPWQSIVESDHEFPPSH
jgi:hypothetical protein